MRRVVVVGAGVVGVACAYYLHKAGCAVVLIDKGAVGGGCSHANCGFVCPSHVLPLAGPGVLGKTLRTLLQKGSPLVIRLGALTQPRSPALWAWLVRFALRCNRFDMLRAGHALQALLDSSRQLYGELMKSAEVEAEFQERGLLFVFHSAAAFDHYAHTDRLLREEFDLPARRYDGSELAALEPALKPGLAGAYHYERDAHLRPDRLMTSWQARLEQMGVEVRQNCPLLGFERHGRRVTAVQTPQGPLTCSHVVVAAGAWTPLLREHLGCSVPIQPGKGYSITTARPALCPRHPLIFEEDRVAITPMPSAYRIGSTMEFAGYDERLRRSRLDVLRKAARRYLVEPEGAPVLEEWWGWRPMVPDGLPLIGAVAGRDNVLVAAGHGMLGLSMAPGTGRLVAELLTDQAPHVDPAPYRVGRF
jgi:D-amino-acid dehydrogenase